LVAKSIKKVVVCAQSEKGREKKQRVVSALGNDKENKTPARKERTVIPKGQKVTRIGNIKDTYKLIGDMTADDNEEKMVAIKTGRETGVQNQPIVR
jgi:hypothetical protein